MRWRTDDEASSTLVSFIIATGVFAVAFTSVAFYASDHLTEREPGPGAYDAVAATAAEALISGPGVPAAWESTGVPPNRWGLLDRDTVSTVDADKIVAVRGWDPSTYDTVKTALGLEDYEMRVRIYPRFLEPDGVVNGLGAHRVAYVGDSVEERTALDATGAVFENLPADTELLLGWAAGDVFDDSRTMVTRHLAPRLFGFPGAEDAPEVGTNAAADTYWRVALLDEMGYQNPGGDPWMDENNPAGATTRVLTISSYDSGAWSYGDSTSVDVPTATSKDRILLTAVDLRQSQAGDTMTFSLRHWHDGEHTDLLPELNDHGAVEFYCTSCPIPGWESLVPFTDDWGDRELFVDQDYSVALHGKAGYLALSWRSYDETATLPPTARDAGQGWFIRAMEFEWARGGTVLYSWKNDLVPDTDAEVFYDHLVVGSQTLQTEFSDATDPTFETALAEWIKHHGHLLATGSLDAHDGWIQRLPTSGTTSDFGGGLYEDRTDHHHSILNNPYDLHYDLYNPVSDEYQLASGDFSPVVQRTLQSGDDVVLLSVPTAAWTTNNEGIAVFTVFEPMAMGPTEARNFYTNALLYGRYYDLSLDYGKRVPVEATIGSATRNVLLDTTSLGLQHMQGELVFHVWQ